MAEQSAHLASAVLPDVPMRQFVLTVPWPLRQRLAVDPALVKTVLAILVDCIFRFLAEKTGAPGGAKGGAVTVIQRFGGTLNLHVHYHVLVTDGLYEDAKPDEDDAPLVFHPLTARVTEDDERAVAEHIHRRLVRLFRRRGWSDEHGAITWPESEAHPESSAVGLLGTASRG
jgi:hypothetical protein